MKEDREGHFAEKTVYEHIYCWTLWSESGVRAAADSIETARRNDLMTLSMKEVVEPSQILDLESFAVKPAHQV